MMSNAVRELLRFTLVAVWTISMFAMLLLRAYILPAFLLYFILILAGAPATGSRYVAGIAAVLWGALDMHANGVSFGVRQEK